jgi:hypothetical protein
MKVFLTATNQALQFLRIHNHTLAVLLVKLHNLTATLYIHFNLIDTAALIHSIIFTKPGKCSAKYAPIRLTTDEIANQATTEIIRDTITFCKIATVLSLKSQNQYQIISLYISHICHFAQSPSSTNIGAKEQPTSVLIQ